MKWLHQKGLARRGQGFLRALVRRAAGDEDHVAGLLGSNAANLIVEAAAGHLRHANVGQDQVEAFSTEDSIEGALRTQVNDDIVVAKQPLHGAGKLLLVIDDQYSGRA